MYNIYIYVYIYICLYIYIYMSIYIYIYVYIYIYIHTYTHTYIYIYSGINPPPGGTHKWALCFHLSQRSLPDRHLTYVHMHPWIGTCWIQHCSSIFKIASNGRTWKTSAWILCTDHFFIQLQELNQVSVARVFGLLGIVFHPLHIGLMLRSFRPHQISIGQIISSIAAKLKATLGPLFQRGNAIRQALGIHRHAGQVEGQRRLWLDLDLSGAGGFIHHAALWPISHSTMNISVSNDFKVLIQRKGARSQLRKHPGQIISSKAFTARLLQERS